MPKMVVALRFIFHPGNLYLAYRQLMDHNFLGKPTAVFKFYNAIEYLNFRHVSHFSFYSFISCSKRNQAIDDLINISISNG